MVLFEPLKWYDFHNHGGAANVTSRENMDGALKDRRGSAISQG